MNTPAHAILGAALFGGAGRRLVALASILGGVLPDIPLMVMVGWSLWVRGISPQTVFGHYYFSDAWQAVFSIDHGFFIWGSALLIAVWRRWSVLIAFAGSGFLHALVDFFVHHDDARAQFWPLTTWRFYSPVSYWDRAYYGQYVGPLEIALCLGLSVLLWRRFADMPSRIVIVLAALAEAVPGILFALMVHKA